MMKKAMSLLVVAAVASLVWAAGPADSPDTKHAMPDAAVAKVKKAFPSATIRECKPTRMLGLTVYEVKLDDQGKEQELLVDGDGTIIEVAFKTNAAALPEAVQKAVIKQAGDGQIRDANVAEIRAEVKVTPLKQPKKVYEVRVSRENARDLKVMVNEDGAVISAAESGPPAGKGGGPRGKPGKAREAAPDDAPI